MFVLRRCNMWRYRPQKSNSSRRALKTMTFPEIQPLIWNPKGWKIGPWKFHVLICICKNLVIFISHWSCPGVRFLGTLTLRPLQFKWQVSRSYCITLFPKCYIGSYWFSPWMTVSIHRCQLYFLLESFFRSGTDRPRPTYTASTDQ